VQSKNKLDAGRTAIGGAGRRPASADATVGVATPYRRARRVATSRTEPIRRFRVIRPE